MYHHIEKGIWEITEVAVIIQHFVHHISTFEVKIAQIEIRNMYFERKWLTWFKTSVKYIVLFRNNQLDPLYSHKIYDQQQFSLCFDNH